ncbi:MAG: phosphopantothenoylcysteine decarboxylase, partial [Paramuribaculum sp.]|nr:phosphopantothenoylcysteine decarboxylase [Paramuribaculum sp.]
GKMGYALAEAAADAGAEVTLISGPVSLTINRPDIKILRVESAKEMYSACCNVFPATDIAIMCAAVADYAPADVATEKIKREEGDAPTIRLIKNPDIAAALGKAKRQGQILVGFALETNNEEVNAIKKIKSKNLDMIVLNSLRDADSGFGTDTNKITLIMADGEKIPFELKSKKEVAKDIINSITSISASGREA